jgi:hypothetical protein
MQTQPNFRLYSIAELRDFREQINALLVQKGAENLRVGMEVSFEARAGVAITGTIERINLKSVTVVNCSNGDRGWRIPPHNVTPVEAAA